MSDPNTPLAERPEPLRPVRRRTRRLTPSGLEARQHRRTMFAYVALAVSACFMVNALVGDQGALGTLKTRRDYTAAVGELDQVRRDNARMQDEIHRLKSDPSAVEDVARRELGLIKPGEVLVVVKDAKPANGG